MKKISYLLKIFGFGILIFIWDYVMIKFNKLPEIIPIHFNFRGVADNFAPKMMIWILPIMATLLYGFSFYLSKNPNSILLNLPQNIKEDKKNSGLILDFLNILVMSIFAVTTYESISVAMGKIKYVSSAINFLLGILFLFVIAILVYSYIISKKNQTKNSFH